MKIILVLSLVIRLGVAFLTEPLSSRFHSNEAATTTTIATALSSPLLLAAATDAWQGEVVSNEGGAIRGCSIKPVGEEPTTQWELAIDG
jgi:hypothetical protein